MNIRYDEPTQWSEAQALMTREPETTVLAGGIAYTLFLRQGLLRPSAVMSLRRVSGADRIRTDAHGGLWIGAMVTHTAVVRSPEVRNNWPEFADAAAKVGTVRIRNQATIVGSVAHADPASDVPVMLAALGAQAIVRKASGAPAVPVDELLVDAYTTSLEPAELIESVQIAGRTPATRAAYLKYTMRTVDDYATVSVAVRAEIEDGAVAACRIFLGGVGPRPMRAVSVERALVRSRAASGHIVDAAALVRGDVDPVTDSRGSAAYKREMARVFTERALRQVLA